MDRIIRKSILTVSAALAVIFAACDKAPEPDPEVSVKLISIEQKSPAVVAVGGTLRFTAFVKPDDATDKSVKWESTDTSVATIDRNGLAKGLKAGTTTIIAHSSRKSITAECKLEVKVVTPATAVTLSPASVKVAEGDNATVSATITPAGSTSTLTWESSNAAVAALTPLANNKCRIDGKKAGAATVKVTTDNGKTVSCSVTVSQNVPATAVSITPSSVPALQINEEVTLTAVMTPSNSTSTLTWTSSNTAIATVTPLADNKCSVKGLSNGSTTIKATTSSGKTASKEITVSQGVTGITLNHTSKTLNLWSVNTDELTATVLPANAADRDVVFTSSNSNIVSTASQGGNKSTINAHATGTATVTATAGGKTATCTYTVTASEDVFWITDYSRELIHNGNSVFKFQSYIQPAAIAINDGVVYVACNDTSDGRVLLYKGQYNNSSLKNITGFDTYYGATASNPNVCYSIYNGARDPGSSHVSVVGHTSIKDMGLIFAYNPATGACGNDAFLSGTTFYRREHSSTRQYLCGKRVNSSGAVQGVICRSPIDANNPKAWFETDWLSMGDYENNYIQDMVHYNGNLYVAHNKMVLCLDDSKNVTIPCNYSSRIIRLAVTNGNIYCLLEDGSVYKGHSTLLYERPGAEDMIVIGNDIYLCGQGMVYKNNTNVIPIPKQWKPFRMAVLPK